MKFEHIQGKKNIVADAISRLRAFGLYQDHDNEEVQLSLEDAVKNIIKEIHSGESIPKIPIYTKMNKLIWTYSEKNNYATNFAKGR